jgi:putative peptidoglycan lipid II flippase
VSPTPPPPKPKRSRPQAIAVAAGILLSRLFGLVRDRVFAHYFGNADAADAFRAAFRIPNILQNLFGEGVLSASFIPVYAKLRAEETAAQSDTNNAEATQLASAIFAILLLVTTVLVALGVFAAPALIGLIAPGFHGPKRLLTIHLVQILFPGTALLVLSAWCLGILNSHRRFFLSYAAPVVWNIAMIATLLGANNWPDNWPNNWPAVWAGNWLTHSTATAPGLHPALHTTLHTTLPHLAALLAIGSVLGSALQFLIQLPTVLRILHPLRLNFPAIRSSPHVRTVLTNFAPVFLSRGVVQISAYVDSWLASFLGTGALSALSYAQTLYTLPVSLFGMAISAAELPAMSSVLGTDSEIATHIRERLARALRHIAFFVIPSAVAFVLLGDVIVSTIYRSGRFQAADVFFVRLVLAGSAVGLLASTSGRLYSSAFYALRNPRTPLRFAILRVTLTLSLGYLFAIPLPHALGLNQRWGTAGLALSAGLAGWVEFFLLRRALHRQIGPTPSTGARTAWLWLIAVAAALAAFALKRSLPFHAPLLAGPCVLLTYGTLYLAITHWFGLANIPTLNRLLPRKH